MLDVNPLNSIIFYEYSNNPTETPEVDWVIELYPTLESKELPKSVLLSTVIRYCALLVGVGVHVEADIPAAKGAYANEVNPDEHVVHFVASLKTEQLPHVEWHI